MIDNKSCWQVAEVLDRNHLGHWVRVLIVKQSFEFSKTGEVSMLMPAAQIFTREQYLADPATSSLRNAVETMAFKQGFELYGQLVACPPHDRLVRILAVALRFGRVGETPLVDKVLHIVGARHWRRSMFEKLLGCTAGEPSPLSVTPIVYEQAFGGVAKNQWYPDNPVGIGFGVRPSQAGGLPLPCIELPGQMIRRSGQTVPVAGFGPLPRHWQPRLARQIDADESALLNGDSFAHSAAPNIHNCAPDDQQLTMTFGPGYQFELMGLLPDVHYDQTVRVELPYLCPQVRIFDGTAVHDCSPRCDTLVIDGEAQCFHLLWRGLCPVEGPEMPVYWRLENAADTTVDGC